MATNRPGDKWMVTNDPLSVEAYEKKSMMTPTAKFAPGLSWKKGGRAAYEGFGTTQRTGKSVWSKTHTRDTGFIDIDALQKKSAVSSSGAGGAVYDDDPDSDTYGQYIDAPNVATGGGRDAGDGYEESTVKDWWRLSVRDPYADWIKKEPAQSTREHDVQKTVLPSDLRATLGLGEEEFWAPKSLGSELEYAEEVRDETSQRDISLESIKNAWITEEDAAGDEVLTAARAQLQTRLTEALVGTQWEDDSEGFTTALFGPDGEVTGSGYTDLSTEMERAEDKRAAEDTKLKKERIKANLLGGEDVRAAQTGAAATGFAYSGAGAEAIETAKYGSRATMGELAQQGVGSRETIAAARKRYGEKVGALTSGQIGAAGEYKGWETSEEKLKTGARDYLAGSMETLGNYQAELSSILGFAPSTVTTGSGLQKDIYSKLGVSQMRDVQLEGTLGAQGFTRMGDVSDARVDATSPAGAAQYTRERLGDIAGGEV